MRAACQFTWDKPLLLVPTNWTAQARPRTRMDLRHATVWVASVLRMLRCAQGQEAGARVLHAISHGTTPCCLAPPAGQHKPAPERAWTCDMPQSGWRQCFARCRALKDRRLVRACCMPSHTGQLPAACPKQLGSM